MKESKRGKENGEKEGQVKKIEKDTKKKALRTVKFTCEYDPTPFEL